MRVLDPCLHCCNAEDQRELEHPLGFESGAMIESEQRWSEASFWPILQAAEALKAQMLGPAAEVHQDTLAQMCSLM